MFAPGEGWRTLGLTGEEAITLDGLRASVLEGTPVQVIAERAGFQASFAMHADVQTAFERKLLIAGGMLPAVLTTSIAGTCAGIHVP